MDIMLTKKIIIKNVFSSGIMDIMVPRTLPTLSLGEIAKHNKKFVVPAPDPKSSTPVIKTSSPTVTEAKKSSPKAKIVTVSSDLKSSSLKT